MLFFLLGLFIIPVGMMVIGLFRSYTICIRPSHKAEYSISFGFELEGIYQSFDWFSLEKVYYYANNEIEYAYILSSFWEGKAYWNKRNAQQQAKLELLNQQEDEYFEYLKINK